MRCDIVRPYCPARPGNLCRDNVWQPVHVRPAVVVSRTLESRSLQGMHEMGFDGTNAESASMPTIRTTSVVLLLLLGGLLAACNPASDAPALPQTTSGDEVGEFSVVRDWVADGSPEPDITAATRDYDVPPVEDMISGLERRLEETPDDVKGWALLAQSYAHVGRMSDAREATDRAVALGADRTDLEARVHRAHVGPL